MIRKWIVLLGLLVLLLAAACGAAVWFVKPQQQLDLTYSELRLGDKLMDMLRALSLQVTLNERDINDLAKKQLAAQPQLPHGLLLEGARFELRGDELAADVNLRWHNAVPVGARLLFQLSWHDGRLLLTHRQTTIRGVALPSGWLKLPELEVPLGEQLPPHVGVKDVVFEPSDVRIALKLQ
uniref:Uncharacterized protein n=1 Tax=Paenibacillus athensensis TaxID=1967502 RepID=A0A4Y8Q6I5_9BACL